jgi:hypothetical protein
MVVGTSVLRQYFRFVRTGVDRLCSTSLGAEKKSKSPPSLGDMTAEERVSVSILFVCEVRDEYRSMLPTVPWSSSKYSDNGYFRSAIWNHQ